MKKTFLILTNNAPYMSQYHKALGEYIERDGHNVIYAFSDRLAVGDSKMSNKTHVFSDYFKKNYNNLLMSDERCSSINVWNAFFSDFDRIIVNGLKTKQYKYYETLFVNLMNFYSELYKMYKIDYIIYENVSNSFAYFAYEVGKIYNVKYIGYCPSKLPNRIELHSEVMNTKNEFSSLFSSIKLDLIETDEKKWIDNYLEKYNGTIPSYHPTVHPLCFDYSFFRLYFNKSKLLLIKKALHSLVDYKNYKYYYQISNPFKMYLFLFRKQLRRRFKIAYLKNKFDQVDFADKYFLFPLQMIPESSTSVWAKNNVDQLNTILNISSNLPFGVMLYVKEHFVNFGSPTLDFYKKLKNIPNVKFIHPHERNFALIKNSLGVITLTSTMGFEALLMKKRVLLIGNIFYESHPYCIKIDSFDDLFNQFSEILNTSIYEDLFEQYNKKFIAAYYRITFEGDTDFASYTDFYPDKFIDSLYFAIKKKYEIS